MPFVEAAGDGADVPADAADVLREWEARWREEVADVAPAFDAAAAGWAARMFWRASQFLMDREPGEDVVRRVLAEVCPRARGAGADYSVDLVFRFLPDLLRLAEQRAPQDALTEILRGWALEWPLSSAGVAVGTATVSAEVLAHPALRRLYLDRIFACGAKDRLNEPGLRRWIEADAGSHVELAPKAAALTLAPTPLAASPFSNS